mmetsp:Transcript_46703/g.144033  ORF Transcript_46703/g.144033 Transcript_46703/m.144033 type:complete len:216 (-) Transcript_46703:642-1289(-)
MQQQPVVVALVGGLHHVAIVDARQPVVEVPSEEDVVVHLDEAVPAAHRTHAHPPALEQPAHQRRTRDFAAGTAGRLLLPCLAVEAVVDLIVQQVADVQLQLREAVAVVGVPLGDGAVVWCEVRADEQKPLAVNGGADADGPFVSERRECAGARDGAPHVADVRHVVASREQEQNHADELHRLDFAEPGFGTHQLRITLCLSLKSTVQAGLNRLTP